MSVTSNHFLLSAEELIKGDREIDFRNSASRAYYSCYLEARSYAKELPDVSVGKGGAHIKVIRKFAEYSVKNENQKRSEAIRKIGFLLDQVKSHRTRADYKIDGVYLKNDAEQTIGEAKKIINKIQSL